MNISIQRQVQILATALVLACAPVAVNAADYADVVRVTQVGSNDCRYDEGRERDSDTDGKIVGAIVGGLVGNQVGSGSGRTVATVGGAVAGAAIGGKIDRNNDRGRRSDRGCADTAYRVDYRWDGDVRSTRLAYHPGRSVRVNRHGDVIR